MVGEQSIRNDLEKGGPDLTEILFQNFHGLAKKKEKKKPTTTTKQQRETSISIARVPAENRNEYLPNASPEFCRYSILFGMFLEKLTMIF
jgi:hypothetical protein